MIIYEEGKIVAISKNLLNILNIDLKEISEIISQIELETAVLHQKTITIQNNSFKIEKEPLITLKNLTIFKLQKEEIIPNIIQQQPEEKTETPAVEELNPLKITAEEEKEEIIPNIIQQQPEEKTETPAVEELSPLKITAEEEKEEIIPNIIENDNLLELDFEENISECEKILSQKNIKELIDKELQVAMEELGIDEEMAKELFDDLLQQIKEKKEAFYKALKNKDYNELHEIAHYLKGASLNLRLSNLSFIFKTIDEESKKEANLQTIKKLIDDFYNFLERFEKEETNEVQPNTNTSNENIKIDPKIKNIVLNTIQRYLETQDEQKFQKDKKFLEKLLNKNINSLQDLEYLWKDKQ